MTDRGRGKEKTKVQDSRSIFSTSLWGWYILCEVTDPYAIGKTSYQVHEVAESPQRSWKGVKYKTRDRCSQFSCGGGISYMRLWTLTQLRRLTYQVHEVVKPPAQLKRCNILGIAPKDARIWKILQVWTVIKVSLQGDIWLDSKNRPERSVPFQYSPL